MSEKKSNKLKDDEFFANQKLIQQKRHKKILDLINEPVTMIDITSKCPKCKQNSLRYNEKQVRSADESADYVYTCENGCNLRKNL
jgi:DNA-directed RNA polymerase subunit M/transcription elongation factor TFIIS